ncbi:MAG: nucleotidyltransferase [Armatimonadetes bacterium]|nr:nucleotidyltransferase [Armatimonadota bacterium]
MGAVIAVPKASPPEETQHLVESWCLPIYYEAAQVLERNGVPSLLGGGLMVSLYGRARQTKDIDFYVHPRDKNRAMSVLNASGFHTQETEKPWLLKAEKEGAPVDLIVHSGGMPDLDEECLAHSRTITLGGYLFRGFGPEDMLLRKIYSFQDGRPDWYDALSMIQCSAAEIDWGYFLRRVPDNNPARALSFLFFAHAHFQEERIPWDVIRQLGAPYLCLGIPLPHGQLPQ